MLERIRTYQNQLGAYKDWLVSSASKNIWGNRPELIDSPAAEIRSIAAKKLWSARIYKKASDPKKIQNLTIELKELSSRKALSAVLEAVTSLHDRIIYRGVLDSCKTELNPRILSAKSKDIAGRLITNTLRESLEDEFRRLGVGHIKTKLKERVDRGAVKFTLLLYLPAAKKIDLILSEGEQRAIALGAFLAELKLSNHGGGIIFDDPVSSLDHVRRRRFARRLVDESSIRQVIVLTHDIAFLSELIDSLTESAEIPHRIHHLEWVGEEAGVIKQGLPWDKTGYKERVTVLQTRARNMAPWPAYPSDELIGEVRLIYSDIRATVERVVEDVVLNGIVTRFSDMVGVGNLHKITGLRKEDADQIVSLWKKCHRITGAHHQAQSKEIPVEGLEEIISDIDSILLMAKNVVSYRAKPDGV